jgi:catechol 2,3-dioxygenase-like lactoylglutathione lyase family enzyme
MVLGLRTAIYPVPDLAAGKAWYSRVLGREPYFDQPFYVGYAVGGFELGLIPDGKPRPGRVSLLGRRRCGGRIGAPAGSRRRRARGRPRRRRRHPGGRGA